MDRFERDPSLLFGLVPESLPPRVGDRAFLEEQTTLGAGERGLLGRVEAATLDLVALSGGAGGIVATVEANGHVSIVES